MPHRRALVLYDTQRGDGGYGAQQGVLAANFVSNFGRPVRQPVRSYRRGEMKRYAAVVYVGADSGERLPRAFLTDVRVGVRPVMWLDANARQLTDPAFARVRLAAGRGCGPPPGFAARPRFADTNYSVIEQ